MKSFGEFVAESVYGWLDHHHRFVSTSREHPNHDAVAAHHFGLKHHGEGDAVRHALKHGWTRVYIDHDGYGAVQHDPKALKGQRAHRIAVRSILKRAGSKRGQVARIKSDEY